MRAVVALVEARPETIIEDYDRLLELAGLAEILGDFPVALVPQGRAGGWFPGAGSPPWQLDGVLTWLQKRRGLTPDAATGGKAPVVLPVSPASGSVSSFGWAWEDVMVRHGAEPASEHFRHPRSFRAEPALPALETALPRGLSLPAGLRDRPALLLPVPALDQVRPLIGAVALLRSLLAAEVRTTGGDSAGEILADVIRFARQALPGLGVVMDGVFWQLGPRPGTHPPVARNILLAGRDPVAVDAVAARLAGRTAERDPLLRECRDQGLGAVRETDIRVIGRTDLLDLDFGVPDRITAGPAVDWNRLPWSDLFWRTVKRPSFLKQHARTPWGGLFETYRAGGSTGDQR